MHNHTEFMQQAITLAQKGMDNNEGGPFGAIVVKDGQVVGTGSNRVTSTQDPTAHAEVVAIRDACRHLNTFELTDCIIYTSCEPCPMCLGAIYWARPKAVYFGCSKEDAARVNFDDHFIYEEINTPKAERKIPMLQMLQPEAWQVFEAWKNKLDKRIY
ncbi:MAG: nucleoside deaminase [Saprospiraceae bacterium]|nr:nucleoside deaminase [Saprospiraceae bacterium]